MTDAVEIDVVPYERSGDPIPLEVTERLADEGRIRYMKYAFRSVGKLQALNEALGERVYKFCGADSWTLRYLLLGCSGIMAAVAAVLPRENVELLRLVQRGEVEAAHRYWYEKLLPWTDCAFYECWQWAHRLALKWMGVISSDRGLPPQRSPNEYQREELKAALRYIGKL